MGFNQQRGSGAGLASTGAKVYAQGALVAFTAPLGSFKGSQIALSGVTATSIVSTAGLVISMAGGSPAATPVGGLPVQPAGGGQQGGQYNIGWESLYALVETDLTTSTITASSMWQGSWDGTNWVPTVGVTGLTKLLVAAAGTGSLVTKQYMHPLGGQNPPYDFLRLAVQVGVVTGAAGDNVTVAYGWRRRSFQA